MIFDLYTTLQIYDRPKITVLRREMSRVWAMDNPVGDPFGGAAYGEYNTPVVKAVEDAGRWIDREVLQPVYREVIQPVGQALEKIGQGIAKDPLTFIAQAAAIAAAPFTAGQSLWALPVISAASTAAKGGSLEQILTATAISAATAAVGGGFGLENTAGSWIMNGMQTGVNAAGQATYAIMGTQIAASTASAIATAGTGLTMAGVSAVGAAVQGKDPLAAALPSLVGTALGFGADMLAGTEMFQGLSSAINEIGKSTSPIVQKALTGVASSAVIGALTGTDMTEAALAGLAKTVISGVVSSSNYVADYFRNDEGNITNMGAATQSIVADLLGTVGATLASNGKMGAGLGAEFLVNSAKTITPFLTGKFDADATNVRALYLEAEQAAAGINEAALNQNNLANRYNAQVEKANSLAAQINDKIAQRDSIYNQYNASNDQATINRLGAEFKQIEADIAKMTGEYNAIDIEMDSLNGQYIDASKITIDAQNAYFDLSKRLGEAGTNLSVQINDMAKTLTTNIAKDIDPDFNAEEYRTLNNLGAAVDPATHFLSAGKDQGLFTNFKAADAIINSKLDGAMEKMAVVLGYGSVVNMPTSIYNDARDKISSFYGNNLQALSNFTVDGLVQQSKLPATAYAPMWDSDTNTLTTAKVIYKDGKEQLVNVSTVLPENKQVATFKQIMGGQASLTAGSDGNWYWTTNDDSTSAMLYDASTGDIVKSIFSGSLEKLPEGATNPSYGPDGNLVGYTSADGVLHVVVSGVENNDIEYKDFGTDINAADPYAQMFTYANLPSELATQFGVQDIVNAAGNVVDYFQSDASNARDRLAIAKTLDSVGSVSQDIGAVLDDLSSFVGLSKSGDSGVLAKLGKGLQQMALAKTPEEYKAAAEDIKAMREAAKGADIASVNLEIAQKYPDYVGVTVFGGELIEEFVQSGLAKGVGVAAGGVAAIMGAPALMSAAVIGAFGYGSAMALDFAESYRGSKEETYKRAYDIFIEQGMSQAQAAQSAEALAIKAGLGNGVITMVVNGATPFDLNKVLFKGKANPAQEAVIDYFIDKATTFAKVGAAEFVGGGVEGALQGLYTETLIYGVDPSKADITKGVIDSAMLESIVGAPVASATYGVSAGFETMERTFTLANNAFNEAITNKNIVTLGELGSVFNKWGIPQDVKIDILPDIIEENPNVISAYNTGAEYLAALKANFAPSETEGILQRTALDQALANIANTKFDNEIVTAQEAKDKLFAAGLTNVTDEDVIASGGIGGAGADLDSKIAQYANEQMVSEAELRAAAAQENYDITADDLSALVGRGVQADVVAKFIAEVDPKAVTTAEATQYFLDQGYDKARAEDIAQFVKSSPEEAMKTAVAEWVNPRQVTRSEALQFFSEIGYVPTEAEINQYVVQGPEVFQDAIKTQLGEYVDPRYVDAEEVRQAFANMGLNAPVAASDVLRLSGQYAETELAGKAESALPVVSANAIYALLSGNSIASQQVKDEILGRIEQYKNLGMDQAAAQAAATQAVAAQLGTTKTDLLSALGATEQNLLAEITGVKSDLLTKIEQYRSEGMTQAEANAKAVEEVSAQLGVTKTELLSQLGATESNLLTQISGVSAKVDTTAKAIMDQMAANQAAGQSADTALSNAIDKVASDLGSTKDSLLAKMGLNQTELQNQIAAVQAGTQAQINTVQQQILDKVAQYQTQGYNSDLALQAAIDTVANSLGTTKTDLLTQLGTTEAGLKTYVTEQVSATESRLADLIAKNEAAGMARSEATQAAIDDLAGQLGTTRTDLLTKIDLTSQQFQNEIEIAKTDINKQITLYQQQTGQQLADTKAQIQSQMAAYEQAGIDRDTALDLAIAGVAQDLGTTKTDLLTQMGATEDALRTEFTQQTTALSTQVQDVAKLLGKPVSQVTANDITMVKNMIAQQTATDLAYDVNQDGVIDIKDQTALEQQLAIQQNPNIQQQIDPLTGVTVNVDTTTGQIVETWMPAAGTPWAATGIYSALEQQKLQQGVAAAAAAKTAKEVQQKSQFGQLMGMLFQAPDAAGQQVTVKTPDPAKINYIYDWSSIFATPSQAGLMPSPYGAMNTVAPQQQAQAANQPMFKTASGFASGGIVNSNDIQVGGSVDDLINILKGN